MDRRKALRHGTDAITHPAPISRALLAGGLKASIAPFVGSRILVWAATWFGVRNIPAPPGLYPVPKAPRRRRADELEGHLVAGLSLAHPPLWGEVIARCSWSPTVPFFGALALLCVVA